MTGVSHARLHLTRTPRIAHAARRIQGNAEAGRDGAGASHRPEGADGHAGPHGRPAPLPGKQQRDSSHCIKAMKVKHPRNAPKAGPDRNPSQEPTDRPQRPIPSPPGSESASLEGRTALPCTSSLVAAVDDSTSACLAGSCRLLRRYPRRNTTRDLRGGRTAHGRPCIEEVPVHRSALRRSLSSADCT